jgi:F0F1-type ATP synthase membrane subunit c/vacuolar-type H+-ATPase subunit K
MFFPRSRTILRFLAQEAATEARTLRPYVIGSAIGWLAGAGLALAVTHTIMLPKAVAQGIATGRATAAAASEPRIEDAYFQGAVDLVTGRLAVHAGEEREYLIVSEADRRQRQVLLTSDDQERVMPVTLAERGLRISRSRSHDGESVRPGGVADPMAR